MRRYSIDARPLLSAVSGIPLYTRRLIEHIGKHLEDDEELLLYLPTPIRPGSGVWKDWRAIREWNVATDGVKCAGKMWALWLHALLETRLKLKVLPVDMHSVLGDVSVFHATNLELLRTKRARHIVTMYDLAALHYPKLHNKLQIRKAKAYKKICREADAVICISEATRRDVVELLGIERKKTHVIYPASGNVCEPKAPELAQRSLTKYNLPKQYILYLGTIEPRKNLVNLMQAFTIAAKQGKVPHHLVLAGRKGWLCDDIYREAETSLLREKIHMIGDIPQENVAALMSGADLFAFPSFMEGLGMPVLEAMNCGVPVITSNTSSLLEIAQDAAVLINPSDIDEMANGMIRILNDKILAETLRAKGMERARQFSWDRCARETLDIYRRFNNGI